MRAAGTRLALALADPDAALLALRAAVMKPLRRDTPLARRMEIQTLRSDGCWEWQATRTRLGYGRIRRNGRSEQAHRIAWELANGPIPDGLMVLHRCDNRRCVRPEHLFLGTQLDNMRDASAKGRIQHGVTATNAKLSDADAAVIKAALDAGVSQAALAKAFGVHPATVYAIAAGKTWRHVLREPRPVQPVADYAPGELMELWGK